MYLDFSIPFEKLHLCKSRHPSEEREGLCSKKNSHEGDRERVLVIGATNFLGSKVVSYLISKNITVDAVADYRDLLQFGRHQDLAWYRMDMLHLHHRVSVNLINLTNHTQVTKCLTRAVSKIVFVPPALSSRAEMKHAEYSGAMSDALAHFITILEVVRSISPCTQVTLLSKTDNHQSDSEVHDSMMQSWLSTFEHMLSAYHHYHKFPISIFRVHGVFGPWDESVLDIYFEMGKNESRGMESKCWYIDDVMEILFQNIVMSSKSCQLINLNKCQSDLSSNERHLEHLDRTWMWAHSYAGVKPRRRLHKKKSENNMIFTSYFTTSKDYQRKRFKSPDNFRYMQNFYFSLIEKQMKAVIFHDGLDQGFQHRVHSFYPNVSFVKIESLHGRTTNDARFYAYYQYLMEHSDIANVLMTDMSDVVFQRDPFELISVLGDFLYIGADIDIFPSMASMPWINSRLESCFGSFSMSKEGELHELMKMETVYNAGTIGGSRKMALSALATILNFLDASPPQLNCNMPALNYGMHKHFFEVIFTGFPLNSRFFKWQSSPKGVYILHK